jgi:hypothetical protein
MGPAPESTPPRGDGRIPFTFRIGVTGHCELYQADDLRKPVREAILRLLTLVPIAPGAELALVVVSPLAEGADRLVAEEVLADIDARLEVVLPMDAEDFIRDGSVRRAHRRLGWRDVRANFWPRLDWLAPPGTRCRNPAGQRPARLLNHYWIEGQVAYPRHGAHHVTDVRRQKADARPTGCPMP